MALLLALFAVCSSSRAETLYVTDKLILGVYANSEGSGEQIRIVRSGAQLEVTERVGRYSKVITEEGDEGWVKSQYLVSEPPAILRVDELEAQLQTLRENGDEPVVLRARNLELENRLSEQTARLQTLDQQSKTLQQELVLARDAVAVAQAQAEAAEQRAVAAERTTPPETTPPPPVPPPEPVVQQPQLVHAATQADGTGRRINFFAQLSLVGLGLLLVGMFLGYKALDLHIRRQHGGYRVW
ncbi:MAG: TIGR04211 family SH3 domain-containing protein [Gammaproteobacteria bacterium]|nr:TIGR04211 family SH3 domain-containing protein [Gammaproteobacteria bacterium]